MKELESRIHDENNGLDYELVGDYYIPVLAVPEEHRPIGRYGRMHGDYLKDVHSARYDELLLTGKLWTYLSDLSEQAEIKLECVMEQMKVAESITEEMKDKQQLIWVQRMNSIRNRAEEIIQYEMIYR